MNESNGKVSIWVESLLPVQTNIIVKFEVNEPVDQVSPVSLTLLGNDRKRVFTTKNPASSRLNVQFSTASFFGNPNAISDPKISYCLPYSKQSSFKLVEGYGGSTHKGIDQYSLDFGLPEGTPIQAARDGVVIDQAMNVTTHGLTEADASTANFIEIVHADGTVAMYAHLQNQGSVVKIGQKVKAGQLIGYSGNTGFSRGPHLHFQVSIPNMNTHRSIPVTFSTLSGAVSNFKEKQVYTSVCGSEMSADVKRQTSYRQNVMKTLHNYSPKAFENCYAPYLAQFRKNRGPVPKQGMLEFNVELGSTGIVRNIKTIENKKLPIDIERCVSKGIRALKFESSSLKSLTVPYAVTFAYH